MNVQSNAKGTQRLDKCFSSKHKPLMTVVRKTWPISCNLSQCTKMWTFRKTLWLKSYAQCMKDCTHMPSISKECSLRDERLRDCSKIAGSVLARQKESKSVADYTKSMLIGRDATWPRWYLWHRKRLWRWSKSKRPTNPTSSSWTKCRKTWNVLSTTSTSMALECSQFPN